jgi:UDP-N-acetylmuramoyl-tripeptide--D-alanyl-D-alanine ligase
MGDMLELGPRSIAFHQEAGEAAAEAKVALLVGVGPLSKLAVEAARRAGLEAHAADNATQAAQLVPGLLRPSDLVVIKGSRGMRLELVVDALVARRGEVA